MFFDGVIATKGDYSLATIQDGELVYDDKLYIGKDIITLTDKINDVDIDDEVTVDIWVDKFFAIKFNDTILEEYVYCDFDDAIEGFTNFLNEVK